MNIDIDEKEKKKRYRWQIAFTTAFILVIIGSSLAVFFTKKSGSPFNLNSKQLVDITYAAGDTLKLTNNAPIFPENMESEATSFEFTINNPNTFAVYASINLDNISMSSSLKTYDFKWALYDGDTKLTTGTFLDTGTTLNMYNNSVIDASSSKTYTVRVWINETLKEQSLQSTSFSSNVKVTAYSKKLSTLASKVLSETINTTTPTFTMESTDRGLFVQQDDNEKSNFGFPTYYYKGSTTSTSINSTYAMNNYVSFGTYKTTNGNNTVGQPIIWRIMRINEDGSIRLITEKSISSSMAWSTSSPITFNYVGSSVQSTINTWYNSNIGSNSGTTLDSLVQTGDFCNDISNDYAAVRLRLGVDEINPKFTCPSDGILINAKAGTISADELMYSGTADVGNGPVDGNYTYLSSNSGFWTMSPCDSQNGIVFFYPIVSSSVSVSNSTTVRAVINLKPDVIVKSGNGSSTNPYIIKN